MSGVKTKVLKAAMSGLYHSGAYRLLAPYTQGMGVIFTLHHVRPWTEKTLALNRILEVTPEFLDAVLDQVQAADLDVVSLDEAMRRLKAGEGRRFVSFTFDDGYRDNLEHAYPLFKRRSLPLTLFVRSVIKPTSKPRGIVDDAQSCRTAYRNCFDPVCLLGEVTGLGAGGNHNQGYAEQLRQRL